VFLSRLCGEPIGFTVVGIFVIDKNTILTVRRSITVIGNSPLVKYIVYFVQYASSPDRKDKPGIERVQAHAGISRSALCAFAVYKAISLHTCMLS